MVEKMAVKKAETLVEKMAEQLVAMTAEMKAQ